MKEFLKHAFKSKTIQIAVIQAVAGVAIAAFTELDMIGWVAVTKSVVDIYIRSVTTKPLSEK